VTDCWEKTEKQQWVYQKSVLTVDVAEKGSL